MKELYRDQFLFSDSFDSSQRWSIKYFFLPFFPEITQFNLRI